MPFHNDPLIFCLMGPTASGKTAQACELVQQFPMEIISIDSTMIYRGMNIGAAKPEPEVLAHAPHHLIDILDPTEIYSAAQCCDDVQRLCQSIQNRGKIPLLVGGTMMYFHALQQGLSSLPEADDKVRAAILQQAAEQGWAALHKQLTAIDPVSAARIHPNDTQRIQRALEVFAITQKPLSVLWDETKTKPPLRFINLILMPNDRANLHARIAERFKQMLADGLIEEVEQLIEKWSLTASHPSMRSVGYRQVLGYLQGEYNAQTLCEKGIAATRQLAKRQLTWLRHWPDTLPFIVENHTMNQEMVDVIKRVLTA